MGVVHFDDLPPIYRPSGRGEPPHTESVLGNDRIRPSAAKWSNFGKFQFSDFSNPLFGARTPSRYSGISSTLIFPRIWLWRRSRHGPPFSFFLFLYLFISFFLSFSLKCLEVEWMLFIFATFLDLATHRAGGFPTSKRFWVAPKFALTL